MSTPEKCPYVVCMDTCELLCSGQFVGINSKNARGILEDRMKQKEERNNVMKKANETVVLCGASAYEEKILSESAVLQTAGAHPSGTADHVCTVYTESRRNPDAGIYAGRSSGI